MSHRSSSSRGGGHLHCDSCYSRRCRTRVEVSVSCALASCRLLCGAVFHLCKEEDHLLLCPNVRVPCINAGYGCPLQLPRCARAAHLQACPASVVSCSMEWNRWPAHDAHSHLNTELHQNLLRERQEGGHLDPDPDPDLDLAMALKDQDRLFHSLKMKKLFPELIQTEEEEEEEEREEERREEERRKEKERKKKEKEKEVAARGATWQSFSLFNIQSRDEEETEKEPEEEEQEEEQEEERELTLEEREAIARAGIDASMLENYTAWERMFSMEMGGCREAGARGRGRGRGREGGGLGAVTEEEEEEQGACRQVRGACTAPPPPCRSSSSSSSKRTDFDYCPLEPMKIITVRTFRVPTSFSARQGRIRNPNFYRRESKAVDTSDLEGALEGVPVWEEVQASLLCSLERELRGHLIAETVCSDTLLQDQGTQTYSFLSAPFQRRTSLAELTASKPPELHLQLQVEAVTSRHHKASSAFTFVCGHTFQRREYGQHYRNVHSDIQMGVNGWFQQRCPLAYLGCTFSRRRFRPSTHQADVSYNEALGCFSLRPSVSQRGGGAGGGAGGGGGEDPLSSLPYELLCHLASFLDSLSLSQLALVSHLMRQVVWSLLQDRGTVSLRWDRHTSSSSSSSPEGGVRWRVKEKVWQFSTLFSPVDAWCFRDDPSMSEHLKVCPHYETESRTERVCLPRVQEEIQARTGCKGPTLVSLFQHKRIMM